MPFEIRARNGGKLVLVRHSQDVDCREITDALAEISRVQDPTDPPRLLIDVRAADSFPRYEELLAWLWQHPGPATDIKRLALVTSEAHRSTIEAIAAGHEARHTPVRIFEDELEALTWVMRARGSSNLRSRDAAFEELAAVRIFVSDVARARMFYAEMLGLGAFEHMGCECEPLFRLSNASFLVAGVDRQDERFDRLVGRVTGISFRVKDIDATFVRLSSLGVKFCGEPRKQESGLREVDFHDPDDNVLTLIS
jgi:catechol 2,3-dioxygenase-like lactoylglutathione lyase family enzyme